MRQKGSRKSMNINELIGEIDPNAEPGELGRAFNVAVDVRHGLAEAMGIKVKRPFGRGARNITSEDDLVRSDGQDQ